MHTKFFEHFHSVKSKQSGASLVSVLVAAGIGGILMLGIASVMRDMVSQSARIDLETELSSLRSDVTLRLDCKRTLDDAKAKLGLADYQNLCNAQRQSSATIDGYDLSQANPLRMVALTKKMTGSNKTYLMEDVTSTNKFGSMGGGWLAQVGCDWVTKTIVVKVKQKKPDASGKKIKETLLFGDVGFAPPLCRNELLGTAPPPPPPPSAREQMSEVRYTNTLNNSSQNDNYFDIEVDPRFKMVEISIYGQWEGVHDSGADIFNEQIFIDMSKRTFSGAQMVKIGSEKSRARVATWADAPLSSTLVKPNLDHLEAGVCAYMDASGNFNDPEDGIDLGSESPENGNGQFTPNCISKTSHTNFAKKKFPQPHMQCMQEEGNRCVKFRYYSRLDNGDDGGKDWWAMSVVVRKFY